MRYAALVVSALVSFCSLSGCSGAGASSPDPSAVADEIVALARTTSEGHLVVSHIAKTDGMTLPDGRYAFDFHARFTFPVSNCARWLPGGSDDRDQYKPGFYMMGFVVHVRTGEIASFDGKDPCRPELFHDVNHGDFIAVGRDHAGEADGRAIVLKKESGWHVENAWFYIKPPQ